MKTLVVIVLIAVAVSPALAGWGIPWIAWLDPGDGPGPPHPDDPGDGAVLTPPDADPIPEGFAAAVDAVRGPGSANDYLARAVAELFGLPW